MSWNSQDNKRYRGKIDRIYVSETESYEVDYFIDAYLRKRGAFVTNANRDVIAEYIDLFPGRAPIKRVDLEAHLDRVITVTP